MGSTYDLSALTVNGQTSTYSVTDIRDSDTKYFFNVCGDVQPPSVTPANACMTNRRTGNNASAAAWQVENFGNTRPDDCYRLGGPAASGWNFSVYDTAYPARGVVLTYAGGDGLWCPYGTQRSFILQVTCALIPPGPGSYSQGVSVQEVNNCAYQVTLPSIAGCPTQCLTGSNLCSGNGVCGYNTDAGKSQCYCYNGFEGPQCGSATPKPPAVSTEGVLLIIVCIALAGVILLTAYMVIRLRRLTVSADAYGELQGKFNELGQMA